MQRPHFEMPEPTYEAEPHEYWDVWRERYTVAKDYGVRSVVDSFLTPAGDVLLLAHGDHLQHGAWAVGKLDADQGDYFDDEDTARAFYWRKVAESYGNEFLPRDSVHLRYSDRQSITEYARTVSGYSEELEELAMGDSNDKEIDKLKEAYNDAESLVEALRERGVLIEEPAR
jgi:hypothetical protein